MRTIFRSTTFCLLVLLCAAMPALGQVPALINYQGRLLDGTNLYNGVVDMKLRVFDDPTSTIMLMCEDTGRVTVVDGLYSTYIGDDISSGDMTWPSMPMDMWIEVVINSVTMRPRERVVSVVYALLAGGVTNQAIDSMMIADRAIMSFHLDDDSVGSDAIADGAILLEDMNQNTATNGQVMKWNGTAWVASDDNVDGGGESLWGYEEYGMFTPSPLAAGNDVIAMGVGASAGGSYNIVGGGQYNTVPWANDAVVDGGAYNTNNGHGAVIGGGLFNTVTWNGSNSVVAGGWSNTIDGHKSAVGGGQGNVIAYRASYSVIAGGLNNLINTSAVVCVIAGGSSSEIGPGTYQSIVGAGGANCLDGDYGIIGAGTLNRIGDGAAWAGILSGHRNTIVEDADYAAIVGGRSNTCDGSYAFIGGGESNRCAGRHGVIGGGLLNEVTYTASNSLVVGGASNTVEGHSSTIGGGRGNRIVGNSSYATIAGGMVNAITQSYSAVIGGGNNNLIGPGCYYGFIGAGGGNQVLGGDYGFIGAGTQNRIGEDASWTFIGSGRRNVIDYEADYAAIGGGYSNVCTGPYAAIPGGCSNVAAGSSSLAAGHRAKANHENSFVWADGQEADFASSNANSFLVRASGGVGINTPTPLADLHVVGSSSQGTLRVSTSSEFGHVGGMAGVATVELGSYHSMAGYAIVYDGIRNCFEMANYPGSSTPTLYEKMGVVGIGTTNVDSEFMLSVGGKIRCEGVTVETGWADYVFDRDYDLPSLEEVEASIRQRRALPDMPTESEVERDGVELGGMQVKLLQKIEELTLYTIAQEKRIAELERQLTALKEETDHE